MLVVRVGEWVGGREGGGAGEVARRVNQSTASGIYILNTHIYTAVGTYIYIIEC